MWHNIKEKNQIESDKAKGGHHNSHVLLFFQTKYKEIRELGNLKIRTSEV